MSVICVEDMVYARYQAPDLDVMESFLTDFGMRRVERTAQALYMRGSGTAPVVHITEQGAPATLGFGLRAQSEADLHTLAAAVGQPVEDNAEPGGGKIVRVLDPDGLRIDVLWGQTPAEAVAVRAPVAPNPAVDRQRLGQVVRIAPGASSVMRCGHVALLVSDFNKSLAFYQEVLGFRPSDTYYAGVPDNKIAAFMHCGLGQVYTDHHTVALISAQDGVGRFDHTAFEVIDLDDLMHGNAHLASKGYKHSWGIGRHIQGSQLFDYWRDPFGHKIEHWTDGDLVNDDTPVGNAQISDNELSQWAPPLTPEFFL